MEHCHPDEDPLGSKHVATITSTRASCVSCMYSFINWYY